MAYDRIELLWIGEGASFAEETTQTETQVEKVGDGMREAQMDASEDSEDRVN